MYKIVELQTTDGTTAHVVETANTENEAQSVFHQKLSYAAISTVPIHAVVLLDEKGFTIDRKHYTHEEVVVSGENYPG